MTHTKKTLLALSPVPVPIRAVSWNIDDDIGPVDPETGVSLIAQSDPVLYMGLFEIQEHDGDPPRGGCSAKYTGSTSRECRPMVLNRFRAPGAEIAYGFLLDATAMENFLGLDDDAEFAPLSWMAMARDGFRSKSSWAERDQAAKQSMKRRD